METALHSEIKAIAKEKPCLVFTHGAIRNLLINNFISTSHTFKDLGIPIEGYSKISAKFLGFTINPEYLKVDLANENPDVLAYFKIETPKLNPPPPPEPQTEIRKGFSIEIDVYNTAVDKRVFSRIILNVSDLKFKLNVVAPYLKIDLLDFKVEGAIIPDQNRADALEKSEVNDQDLKAVEGGLAYLMAKRVVKSMFSTINKINLQEVFKGIDLLGRWEVFLSDSSTNTPLVIIPSGGINVRKNTDCPTEDVLSSLELETDITPAGTISGDSSHHSWPTTVTYKKSNPREPRTGDNYLPFASLYLTKPALDVVFNEIIPNITIPLHGEEMIGFDGSVTISFQHIGVRIDPARYGLIIDAKFSVRGEVDINADLSCDRVHLVSADFGRQESDLSLRLSFVTEDSKLIIKPQLDNLQVEEFEVNMRNFSGWIWAAGGRALVIQFILEAILEPLAAERLEKEFKNALRQKVNSENIQLIDLSFLEGYSYPRIPLSKILRKFDSATFSSNQDSILVGLLADG